MHDKSVGTDLGSLAGRRPSAKDGASPKSEFMRYTVKRHRGKSLIEYVFPWYHLVG